MLDADAGFPILSIALWAISMCGIAGFIVAQAQSNDWLAKSAKAMGTAMEHRGPDAGQEWVDSSAGLAFAHRRLSVIDTSPSGAQPMVSASGRFVICYNGEVYNAPDILAAIEPDLTSAGIKLRGHSDTEIILEAAELWGVRKTCEHLNGMFAFALWDQQHKQLWLARDRLGIKPLYVTTKRSPNGPAFCFASELKALKALPDLELSIDRDAVAEYLRLNYVPAPKSIYEGVEKLPPGCLLQLDADGHVLSKELFWSLAKVVEEGQTELFKGSLQDATNALEQLLGDAVSRQMVSDVPLGAFLSGGVDSSTVVALMQKASSRPVNTYSIGFENADFDESADAKRVAAHLGTDHHELYVTPQQALNVIPNLPQIYDEPFADSSQIPTALLSKLTRQHVTVALSGDGGDELFAGYNRYTKAVSLSRKLNTAPSFLLPLLKALLERPSQQAWDTLFRLMPRSFRPAQAGEKIHKFASIVGKSGDDIYSQLVSHWNEPEKVVIGASKSTHRLHSTALPQLLDRMRYMDTMTYLPDDILTKVDRATMASSLEARVPLLDHRVVEFAWSLPTEMLIEKGAGKRVLREVLYRHVPASMIERPKMGFSVPIGEWLRGPLRDWAENLLSEAHFARHGLLRPDAIRQKWSEHLRGQRNWQHDLWSVLMMNAWIEQ